MADQSCTACANAGPATACAPQNLKGAIHQNDRSEDKINLYVTGDINAGLPCVILLYDIFGYGHDNLKKVADMISQNGFLVIIPDHFRADPWPIATEIDRSKLMEWLPTKNPKVKQDLVDVISWTKVHAKTNGKFGLVGFCWGGKHSIVNAATGQFSAAVAIHGSMLNAEDMAAIACPVLLMPTSNDTPNDQLEPTLSKTQYGDKCEYHTFSERQHGFMGARGKWEEEPLFKDVLLGVEKTSSFFKKNLADSKL